MNQDLNPNQQMSQDPIQSNPGVVVESPQPQVQTRTPEPQTESYSEDLKPKGKGRILKVILVIITILIVLGLVSYLVYNFFIKDKFVGQNESETVVDQTQQQPTPEPVDVSNWSTYLNTVYGYTIDYPNDWVTQVLSPQGDTIEATINSESFDIYDPNATSDYPIGVATFSVLGQEPFYDDSWENEQVSINGTTFEKYTTSINDNLETEAYLISLGGFDYLEIVFRFSPDDQYKNIFDAMIASLEFLDIPFADDENVDTEGPLEEFDGSDF